MRAITWPTVTVSPSATRISLTVPVAGEGSSTSTLSVEISTIVSSSLDRVADLRVPFEDRPLGDRLAGGGGDDVDDARAPRRLRCGGARRGGRPSAAAVAARGSGGAACAAPLRRCRGLRGASGAAAGADGDARDHLPDGDGVALGDEDLGDRAGRGRGQLDVDLVGGDLDDRVVEP